MRSSASVPKRILRAGVKERPGSRENAVLSNQRKMSSVRRNDGHWQLNDDNAYSRKISFLTKSTGRTLWPDEDSRRNWPIQRNGCWWTLPLRRIFSKGNIQEKIKTEMVCSTHHFVLVPGQIWFDVWFYHRRPTERVDGPSAVCLDNLSSDGSLTKIPGCQSADDGTRWYNIIANQRSSSILAY